MAEESQGGGEQALRGAGPLLLGAAAAAAAGALAVVARKALSDRGESASGEEGGDEGGTRLDDVERVADDLGELVDELRSEHRDGGDVQRLIEIADTISEYADQVAGALSAGGSDSAGEDEGPDRRVIEDLMNRVAELTGGEREQDGSGSPNSTEKEEEEPARS